MANTKITSAVIEAGAILSTHIASGAISSSHLSGINTGAVTEGTNLYYTDTRARASISVTGGNLAYDSATGVLQLTDAEIRDALSATSSGDGSLTYTAGTGVIAYTGPSASEVQAHLSAGTGVTYSGGQISIGQAVGTSDTVSFGNITTAGYLRGPANFTIDPAAYGDDTGTLIIAGNLQVDGTTTTINSTTLTVDDLNLTLASGAADSAAANGAGITVDGASATLLYASTGDKFVFNKGLDVTGNVTLSSTSPLLYLANTTSGTGKTWRFSSASNGKLFITQQGVIDAVTLDHTTGNATFSGTISSGGITTSYGLSLTNGSTNFLLYNNANENLLYMRDTTNGQMITTWYPDRFQVDKNLRVYGILAMGAQTVIDASRNITAVAGTFTGDIKTGYAKTISMDYAPASGAYHKGMSGNNQSTGTARGLHLFNYDNDSNEGIKFWVGTNASRSQALHIADTTNATFAGTISSGAITAPSIQASSGYLNFKRSNDGTDALQILPTGEVVIPSNYFYVSASQGSYFSSGVRFRGTISNDTGTNVTFGQPINVTGSIKVGGTEVIDTSRNLTNIGTISSGAITSSSTIRANDWYRGASDTNALYSDASNGTIIQTPSNTNNAAGTFYVRDSLGTVHFSLNTNTNAASFHGGTISSGAITSSSTGTFTSSVTANGVTIGASDVRSSSNILTIGGTSEVVRIHSGNFDLTSGVHKVGGTTVIDASRNLTNIGTISSGAITSTGLVLNGGRAAEGVTAAGTYAELTRASGGDLGLLFNKDTSKWLIGIDNSDGNAANLRFMYGAYNASAHPGFGSDYSGLNLTYQGRVGVGTRYPGAELEVAGTALVENAKLKAIAASNTDTAVDVFVYDTRKDSDGGAWRKRTQNTSWYNETLNTSTRGARKEFPSVAVIVAEAAKITIYDGDDPDMPMWMVFNQGNSFMVYTNGNALSAITALNGSLCWSGFRVGQINFAKDFTQIWEEGYYDTHRNGISGRNAAGVSFDSTGPRIVHNTTNDVAMTVLPNAPIDADTGLPVPTIAVATNGGISIINNDGTVVDIISNSGSAYTPTSFVDIDDNYNLIFEQDSGGRSLMFIPIPSADRTTVANDGDRTDKRMLPTSSTGTGLNLIPRFNGSNASIAVSGKGDDQYIYGGEGVTSYKYGGSKQNSSVAYITSDYNTGHMVGDIKLATLSDTDTTNAVGTNLVTNGDFASGTSGWGIYGTSGSVANVGNRLQFTAAEAFHGVSYDISGLVVGKQYLYEAEVETNGASPSLRIQIAGIGLITATGVTNASNTVTKVYDYFTATSTSHGIQIIDYSGDVGNVFYADNVSIRLAEEDRSYNNNGLQVFGTVTKTAVATGADLVGYSGFSTSNYLEQPIGDVIGSGDFCMMWWQKNTSSGTTATPVEISLKDQDTVNIPSILSYNYGGYMRFYTRSTAGDWVFVQSTLGTTQDIWEQYAFVRSNNVKYLYRNGDLVGTQAYSGTVTTSSSIIRVGKRSDGAGSPFVGSIALVRVSATAPSEEQIKKMYNDEKHLFQENAKATLYGSSDTVTALAYDDDTELLHVGTSAGRSVFQGLNRVDNTTDAVGTAISASNGLVAED